MAMIIGSQYTQRTYRWNGWKAVYSVKGLPFQYEENETLYTIWTYDSDEIHLCQIWKTSVPESVLSDYAQSQNDSDKLDFETNYKNLGNQSLGQIDTDGAQIVRTKAAKKGWTYYAAGIEFQTSTLGSLYSKLIDGTDRPGISIKFYNASDVEITSSLLISTCVKTVVDFEPPYDYEVIGGTLRHMPVINTDVRLWIQAAPDIPAQYGGSKAMCSNINLKYLASGDQLHIDGRVSKFLTYNATTHTNKLRFIFKHAAGDCQNLMITIEHYRL